MINCFMCMFFACQLVVIAPAAVEEEEEDEEEEAEVVYAPKNK